MERMMAAVTYTKGHWRAEADIQKIRSDKYQGVVLITHVSDISGNQSQHVVNGLSDTPQEALEEAKALAHRLLADLP